MNSMSIYSFVFKELCRYFRGKYLVIKYWGRNEQVY